jgi:hypothetical protein
VFETAGWAVAYAVFCAMFISWTAMLLLEIKAFVVADTVAQWYFSAPALGGSGTGQRDGGAARDPRGGRAVLRDRLRL